MISKNKIIKNNLTTDNKSLSKDNDNLLLLQESNELIKQLKKNSQLEDFIDKNNEKRSFGFKRLFFIFNLFFLILLLTLFIVQILLLFSSLSISNLEKANQILFIIFLVSILFYLPFCLLSSNWKVYLYSILSLAFSLIWILIFVFLINTFWPTFFLIPSNSFSLFGLTIYFDLVFLAVLLNFFFIYYFTNRHILKESILKSKKSFNSLIIDRLSLIVYITFIVDLIVVVLSFSINYFLFNFLIIWIIVIFLFAIISVIYLLWKKTWSSKLNVSDLNKSILKYEYEKKAFVFPYKFPKLVYDVIKEKKQQKIINFHFIDTMNQFDYNQFQYEKQIGLINFNLNDLTIETRNKKLEHRIKKVDKLYEVAKKIEWSNEFHILSPQDKNYLANNFDLPKNVIKELEKNLSENYFHFYTLLLTFSNVLVDLLKYVKVEIEKLEKSNLYNFKIETQKRKEELKDLHNSIIQNKVNQVKDEYIKYLLKELEKSYQNILRIIAFFINKKNTNLKADELRKLYYLLVIEESLTLKLNEILFKQVRLISNQENIGVDELSIKKKELSIIKHLENVINNMSQLDVIKEINPKNPSNYMNDYIYHIFSNFYKKIKINSKYIKKLIKINQNLDQFTELIEMKNEQLFGSENKIIDVINKQLQEIARWKNNLAFLYAKLLIEPINNQNKQFLLKLNHEVNKFIKNNVEKLEWEIEFKAKSQKEIYNRNIENNIIKNMQSEDKKQDQNLTLKEDGIVINPNTSENDRYRIETIHDSLNKFRKSLFIEKDIKPISNEDEEIEINNFSFKRAIIDNTEKLVRSLGYLNNIKKLIIEEPIFTFIVLNPMKIDENEISSLWFEEIKIDTDIVIVKSSNSFDKYFNELQKYISPKRIKIIETMKEKDE